MSSPLSSLLPAMAAAWQDAFLSRQLPAPVAAELIAVGDQLVPAVPTSPGEHQALELDAAGGVSYIRRNGSFDLELDTDGNCSTKRYKVTVPIRVVVVADLFNLECRSVEVGAVLSERLLAAVSSTGIPGAAVGGSGKIYPTRIDNDAARIFLAELGMPVALPARRGVVAMDAKIELIVNANCLPGCTVGS